MPDTVLTIGYGQVVVDPRGGVIGHQGHGGDINICRENQVIVIRYREQQINARGLYEVVGGNDRAVGK
ncbi:MAG: hypothetical protein LUH50_15585 [Bacteroides intestinalis]|nr:hypothetical protein [Bacteroides intestinalis]